VAAAYRTHSTISFVLEKLRWDGHDVWTGCTYDFLHELLVVNALRSSNIDLFVIDVFRIENPSNMILLPFDLYRKYRDYNKTRFAVGLFRVIINKTAVYNVFSHTIIVYACTHIW